MGARMEGACAVAAETARPRRLRRPNPMTACPARMERGRDRRVHETRRVSRAAATAKIMPMSFARRMFARKYGGPLKTRISSRMRSRTVPADFDAADIPHPAGVSRHAPGAMLRDRGDGQGAARRRVKTRLVPPLTAEQAAMSASFLRDITENIAPCRRRRPDRRACGIRPRRHGGAVRRPAGRAGTTLVLADGAGRCRPRVTGFGRSLLHAAQALVRSAATEASAC